MTKKRKTKAKAPAPETEREARLKKRNRILNDVQDHLVATCTRALRLLESMEADGGARLPYPDFPETKAALKAIAEA
jgi:hypothetical protein